MLALPGRLLYVGGRDGVLFALDALSGEERWRLLLRPDLDITAVIVVYGTVYAVGEGTLFAVGGHAPP